MKRSDIVIGDVYYLDGDAVTAVKFEGWDVMVEGEQNGQESVRPSRLKERLPNSLLEAHYRGMEEL